MTVAIISLSACPPLARGAYRTCFIHPHDERLCIKVPHDRRAGHPGYEDPNAREMAEYERLKKLGAPVHRYGPEMFGIVATDLGPGLCVERLRGVGGGPIANVRTACRNRIAEGQPIDDIIAGVRELAAFCIEFGVLAACVGPENIGIVQRRGTEQVVAFDFKGHRNKEFVPISSYIPYFRRRKVARRFERMTAHLERLTM
jgi:hypothetical protein